MVYALALLINLGFTRTLAVLGNLRSKPSILSNRLLTLFDQFQIQCSVQANHSGVGPEVNRYY